MILIVAGREIGQKERCHFNIYKVLVVDIWNRQNINLYNQNLGLHLAKVPTCFWLHLPYFLFYFLKCAEI